MTLQFFPTWVVIGCGELMDKAIDQPVGCVMVKGTVFKFRAWLVTNARGSPGTRGSREVQGAIEMSFYL